MIKGILSIFKTPNKREFIYHRTMTKYYKLFYPIGKDCSFEKIYFFKALGKDSAKNLIKFGDGVIVCRRTEFQIVEKNPILIGDNVFINQGCIICPLVTLGNSVSLGHKVNLITTTHIIGDSNNRAAEQIFKPIVIKNGCWIGANATILGGVTIGEGTIIGAGSVVTRNCEPNSLYVGSPARKIKDL